MKTVPEDYDFEIGAIYQHYKGKNYRILGSAVHSESLEKLVYYECLYENTIGQFWVRPFDNFFGQVEVAGEHKRRFKKID